MNLSRVGGGQLWRARCLWVLLIAGWGHGVVLGFFFTGSLSLREVYEERLLVFFLPPPLIEAISQDDAALPFYQRVLWGHDKMITCVMKHRKFNSLALSQTVCTLYVFFSSIFSLRQLLVLYCILLGSFSLNQAGTRPQRMEANTHSSTGAVWTHTRSEHNDMSTFNFCFLCLMSDVNI